MRRLGFKDIINSVINNVLEFLFFVDHGLGVRVVIIRSNIKPLNLLLQSLGVVSF